MSVCRKCKEEKPDLDFNLRAGELLKTCRKCTHPPDEKLRSNRLCTFGLNNLHYGMLQFAQDNCCAICKVSFSHTQDYVDHCHKTDRVRGLLCRECNCVLGKFKDNPIFFDNAAEYLRQGNTLLGSDK